MQEVKRYLAGVIVLGAVAGALGKVALVARGVFVERGKAHILFRWIRRKNELWVRAGGKAAFVLRLIFRRVEAALDKESIHIHSIPPPVPFFGEGRQLIRRGHMVEVQPDVAEQHNRIRRTTALAQLSGTSGWDK